MEELGEGVHRRYMVICINMKVGFDGCMGVRGADGKEGELKRSGLAICIQNQAR